MGGGVRAERTHTPLATRHPQPSHKPSGGHIRPHRCFVHTCVSHSCRTQGGVMMGSPFGHRVLSLRRASEASAECGPGFTVLNVGRATRRATHGHCDGAAWRVMGVRLVRVLGKPLPQTHPCARPPRAGAAAAVQQSRERSTRSKRPGFQPGLCQPQFVHTFSSFWTASSETRARNSASATTQSRRDLAQQVSPPPPPARAAPEASAV